MTLLVIVAHPDDETFGCGSILMHAAERTRTVVVCATRGEAGEYAPGGEVPAPGLAGIREAELREAAARMGVDAVEVLDFLDSGMDGEPPAGSLCGASSDAVIAAVRSAVERHRPTVVVALDASDGHRDHARIRDAVTQVVGETEGTALYLQCLPRSLMHRWLRHANPEMASPYAVLPDIGTPDEDVTTVLDTTRYYDARRAAIALHRSQHSPFDGLPDDLARRFLAEEHLRRVIPAREGGVGSAIAELDLMAVSPVS
ncbi:PIG-L family deacetylase [Tessaracoccus lubricantis]|uniref:PIG-L family deacetylase n=1 Tax=Tessaracoccus lubricantis TaxID=545543 RepID=A0ABP9FAM6_9ACTN